MKNFGLFIYIGVLLHTIARTIRIAFRVKSEVPSIHGHPGWLYVVLRDFWGNTYFVSDFGFPHEKRIILRRLMEELKYRILFWNDGNMVDHGDLTASVWYPEMFGGGVRFILLDEAPLEDFSKKLIRSVYKDVLDELSIYGKL